MIAARNQTIERHYFERFCQAYSLPAGQLGYGDKPDVTLTGERRIGIEVTCFYLQSGSRIESMQRQRPLRLAVVEQAQALYLSISPKAVKPLNCISALTPLMPSPSAGQRSSRKNWSLWQSAFDLQGFFGHLPHSMHTARAPSGVGVFPLIEVCCGNPRLLCRGTTSSNPSPSSGESCELQSVSSGAHRAESYPPGSSLILVAGVPPCTRSRGIR